MMIREAKGLLALVVALGLGSVPPAQAGGEERERLEAGMSAMADAGDVSGKPRWEQRGDRRKFSEDRNR